jgi:CRP-like cAMP-binding protein
MTASSQALFNDLLARLPANEFEALRRHLTHRSVLPEHMLAGTPKVSRAIHFPTRGVCVVSHHTSDGRSVGIALIGTEGVVGLTAIGGDPEGGQLVTAMSSGCETQTIDVETFARLRTDLPAFNRTVQHFADAFSECLAQAVACNALHSTEQRCAKVLLELGDRLARTDLTVTHGVLADFLGVRRASITLALRRLEQAGLIVRERQQIHLVDRKGLVDVACECYAAAKRHHARLLS